MEENYGRMREGRGKLREDEVGRRKITGRGGREEENYGKMREGGGKLREGEGRRKNTGG